MLFTELQLKGAYVVEPQVQRDNRGSFLRFYCLSEFKQIGHQKEWVQMNHSFTALKGCIRGMHYQMPPYSEIKFLRCIAGKIFDVIIDLRSGSSTYLHWAGIELSAENKKMLYIPEGFAHGFQTLTDNCEMIYHHSNYYNPGSEKGIRFNEPLIDINWPLEPTLLSDRDRNHSFLTDTFKGIKK